MNHHRKRSLLLPLGGLAGVVLLAAMARAQAPAAVSETAPGVTGTAGLPPNPAGPVAPSPDTGRAPTSAPGHFVSWGEAPIRESNLAQAREMAIAVALRSAVEAAAARILGLEAVGGGLGEKEKKRIGEPSRYIQNYRMILQGSVAEVYRVQIDATVLERQLAQALGRDGAGVAVETGEDRAPGARIAPEDSRAFFVELSGDLNYARYREIVLALRASGFPSPEVRVSGFRSGAMTIAVRGLASTRAAADALRNTRFSDFTVQVGTTGDAFVDVSLRASLGKEIPAGPGSSAAPQTPNPGAPTP